MKHYIYLITNIKTNEKYVGETSLGIEARFKTHCRMALKGHRDKYRLYQDIKKFGKENFKIELIEELNIKDRQEALDREAYWILALDTYQNGYNNAPRQCVTSLGYKFTEERKREYSEKFSGENNPMFGKNIKDLMTEEKIQEWKKNLSKARKGKSFSEEHKKNLSKNSPRKKKVIKTCSNGEEIVYESLTEASRLNNLSVGTILNRIKKQLVINNESYKYEK